MVRLLGEGGFGEVYLVENSLIHRCTAVKVLHVVLAKNAKLVRRFLNEARAASVIRHPNIIDVLDAGATADGAPYIRMEFLEGVDRFVSPGSMTVKTARARQPDGGMPPDPTPVLPFTNSVHHRSVKARPSSLTKRPSTVAPQARPFPSPRKGLR